MDGLMRTAGLALLAMTISGPAFAIDCDPKFDFNDNKRIDVPSQEIDICLLHKDSKELREFDRDLNGRLDRLEADEFVASLRKSDTFVTNRADVLAEVGDAGGIKPVKEREPPKKSEAPETVKSGILIRKAYEPLGVIAAAKKKEGEKDQAAGALATFKYDFQNDTYVGSAAGVVEVYRAWALTGYGLPPGATEIPPWTVTNVAIHAGAEFDRTINSADPTRDVDSLTLRGGGEVAVQGPGGEFNFARFNIFDATDFSFNAQLVGAEAEYEPVYLPLAIGGFQPLGGLPVFVRWRPILHAEYQNVVDTGGSAVLAAADNYLFAGPVITGEMAFDGILERLFFDATYWAMWDVLGNADPFQYFEIGANLGLDDKGHLALTARYRDGNLPKTRQSVQDITVGISAKF